MDKPQRESQKSNKRSTGKMAREDSKGDPNNVVKANAAKKTLRRPFPAVPAGHCRDFCRGTCPRGTTCKWRHDEAVKKALTEMAAAMTQSRQPSTYAQAVSGSFPKAAPARQRPESARIRQSLPTPPATPKLIKSEYKPKVNDLKPNKSTFNQKSNHQKYQGGKVDLQNPDGQDLKRHESQGQKPKGQKVKHWRANKQKPKAADPTPPSSPPWRASDAGWNPDHEAETLWNTTSHPTVYEDVWPDSKPRTTADDITAIAFSKIHAEAAKLPCLTTKTRKSRTGPPLFEIVQQAFVFAHKRKLRDGSDSLRLDVDGDPTVLVKAAAAYRNALQAGQIADVLKRSEHAHLEVIIASQHWDRGAITESPPATSTPGASDSTKPSSSLNTIQPTKTVEQSDYLAWAMRNLTDATAIKLARTYCEALENGIVPGKLFSSLGKQAPAGTAFPYFSLLAYELREHIWLYALAVERSDVRLIWQREAAQHGRPARTRFTNANKQQRLLFVNRELRALALRHNYERAFGTRHSRARTYFDFARDRLFLHTRRADELPAVVRCLHPRERERVRVLAVPLRDLVCGDEREIARALCKFAGVRKIHLVCGDGLEDRTYAGAGDAGLARAIQRMVSEAWRERNGNGPGPAPRVRMDVIPALTARYFGIDDIVQGMMYG